MPDSHHADMDPDILCFEDVGDFAYNHRLFSVSRNRDFVQNAGQCLAPPRDLQVDVICHHQLMISRNPTVGSLSSAITRAFWHFGRHTPITAVDAS